MRTLGIRDLAEREEDDLDPDLRAQLDSYCAGVNAAHAPCAAFPSSSRSSG